VRGEREGRGREERGGREVAGEGRGEGRGEGGEVDGRVMVGVLGLGRV
jgi:hypothetical protein